VGVHLGGPAFYLDATTGLLPTSISRQLELVVNHIMLILLALATAQKTTSLRVSGQ